jgi:VWFA-related protein
MPRTLFALCVLAATGIPGAFADDGDVVFRSDVSLVRVDAQVLDRDNRAITGLHAEDFVLREEGRPQPIRNFASENMPIDVLLLLDVSASMRPHVERIADAAHQALRVLRDNDRAGIMVFDRTTRLRLGFRSDRHEVERAFQSLLDQETFRGGTDITRGMLDAADYMRREGRRDARRAIVILTDDQTERDRDQEGVERALSQADTVMSALIAPDAMRNRRMGQQGGPMGGGPSLGGGLGGIIFGQPRGGYGGRRGSGGTGPRTQSAGTAEIARASGGDSMPVDDAYALENTLERIRQRYALYFNLPAGARSGDQRSVSLDLSDAARRRYPDAELRYRHDYYVPAGMKAAPQGGEPTVITKAPTGNADDDQRPILRRPAVSQGSSGSTDGPLMTADPSPAASSPTSAAPAPAPAAAPANQPQSQPQSSPGSGGWRKLKPGEQPQ